MTDNIENLILERLNRMDKKLEALETMQADIDMVKAAIIRIDAHNAIVSSFMAGLHGLAQFQADDLEALKKRVDALENPFPTKQE